MGRVEEGSSSDREQPPEDKEKGPAVEVGLRAGRILEKMPFPTHRVPAVPGSLPGCHVPAIRRLSDPVQEGELF